MVANDSLGLQICVPKADSFYNENVHYRMEGVIIKVYLICHMQLYSTIIEKQCMYMYVHVTYMYVNTI